MSADGVMRPIVPRVVEALERAGLTCQADPRIQATIWEKVAFNSALNCMGAVTGCSVDQLDAVPGGRALALEIAAEVVAVARAGGIDANVTSVHATIEHAIAHHRGHKASMLIDVLRGRPTEIEALNGAVVAAAERLGVDVPKTRTLLTLVRLVEARAMAARAAADPA
jgi:2-dehydropantoate 2-reductase